jgi:protein-disulfide isomerase
VDPGDAVYVWRHFPFLGAESEAASVAAECAADQGAFWPYHDALFLRQVPDHNVGAFSDATLRAIAAELGLDTARFDSCTQDGGTLDRVRAERDFGESLGVTGTPTLFINGEEFTGTLDELFEQVSLAASDS